MVSFLCLVSKVSGLQCPGFIWNCTTDTQGRSKTSYTTVYNGVISYGAQIVVFVSLSITHTEQNINKMHPQSFRHMSDSLLWCATFRARLPSPSDCGSYNSFTWGRAYCVCITLCTDSSRCRSWWRITGMLFWPQAKPEYTKFESYARKNNGTGVWDLWSTSVNWANKSWGNSVLWKGL